MSEAEARTAIEERLVSFGGASDILTSATWTAAPFSDIIAAAIKVDGLRSVQIQASGPNVEVSSRTLENLSLAIHMLCTNATKYRALSREEGQVLVSWKIVSKALRGFLR